MAAAVLATAHQSLETLEHPGPRQDLPSFAGVLGFNRSASSAPNAWALGQDPAGTTQHLLTGTGMVVGNRAPFP